MGRPRDPLSASDALLWRIESDPVLRTPIVVVGLLDQAPSWARVVAAASGAVEAIPRLQRRIDGGGPLGHPAWVDAPGFAVEHHLRRMRAAEPGGGVRAALDLAEPDAGSTFDPARPPWTLTLVEGLDGDEAAFVLRYHHAIADGVGAMGLAEHLFDRSRRGARHVRPAAAPPPVPVARGGSPVSAAFGAARAAARLAGDPFGTLRGGYRFARSLQRVLAAAPSPLSPLLVGRGVDRRLFAIDLPLVEFQHAATAVGGTVNDVWLAGVGGGLHRYHQKLGASVGALRFTVPINVRKASDEAGGNRFAPARITLPIDDPDPVHRAELAGALVRRWRREPALMSSSIVAQALDRLPTPAVTALFGSMLRGIDATATNVPGLLRPTYFAGARIDRLWAFAPPSGAALSGALVSHGHRACIGIVADTVAVSEPELLAACLEAGLDEALAVGAPHRTRRHVA